MPITPAVIARKTLYTAQLGFLPLSRLDRGRFRLRRLRARSQRCAGRSCSLPAARFPKTVARIHRIDNRHLTVKYEASQERMFVRRDNIVKNTGMRVALYARVSTKDKRQDTENQLTQLRQFTVTQGWTVTAEYVDRATGKHSDREQFQRLFQDASQRKFDLVLFWSLDRFSREDVRETLNHLERLTSYGVAYRSFTEQYLDSYGFFKDAVLAILAVIAKQERVRLSERTIAGLEKARKAPTPTAIRCSIVP